MNQMILLFSIIAIFIGIVLALIRSLKGSISQKNIEVSTENEVKIISIDDTLLQIRTSISKGKNISIDRYNNNIISIQISSSNMDSSNDRNEDSPDKTIDNGTSQTETSDEVDEAPKVKTPASSLILAGGGVGGVVYTIIQSIILPDNVQPIVEAILPSVSAIWLSSIWPWLSLEITRPVRRWVIERKIDQLNSKVKEFLNFIENEKDPIIKQQISKILADLKLKYTELYADLAKS